MSQVPVSFHRPLSHTSVYFNGGASVRSTRSLSKHDPIPGLSFTPANDIQLIHIEEIGQFAIQTITIKASYQCIGSLISETLESVSNGKLIHVLPILAIIVHINQNPGFVGLHRILKITYTPWPALWNASPVFRTFTSNFYGYAQSLHTTFTHRLFSRSAHCATFRSLSVCTHSMKIRLNTYRMITRNFFLRTGSIPATNFFPYLLHIIRFGKLTGTLCSNQDTAFIKSAHLTVLVILAAKIRLVQEGSKMSPLMFHE